MQCRQHFGESSRTAPMAGGSTIDRVHIHQRDQGAGGARVGQHDRLAGGVFDRHGVFRRALGSAGQTRSEAQGLDGRCFDRFNGGGICSHKFLEEHQTFCTKQARNSQVRVKKKEELIFRYGLIVFRHCPELMVITVGRDSVEPTLVSLRSKLARRSLAPPLLQVKTFSHRL
jgi:hypothetical protein